MAESFLKAMLVLAWPLTIGFLMWAAWRMARIADETCKRNLRYVAELAERGRICLRLFTLVAGVLDEGCDRERAMRELNGCIKTFESSQERLGLTGRGDADD